MVRVRCLFAKERDHESWHLWFAMSEATWEAGEKFGYVPESFETQECWVEIDDEAIAARFNQPNLKGELNADS